MKLKLRYGDRFVVDEDARFGNVADVPPELVKAWRSAYRTWRRLNEKMLTHAKRAEDEWLAAQPKTGHSAKDCPKRPPGTDRSAWGYCGDCIIEGNELGTF
jgi:hypothetical protein